MTEADQAIADAIEAIAGLDFKQEDGNIVLGPMQAVGDSIPEECVFVHQEGGPAPQFYFPDAGNAKPMTRFHFVQVMYRGDVDELAQTRTRARLIWTKLDRADLSGVTSVMVQSSGPIPSGLRGRGMELYSIPLEVWIQE